MARCFVGFRFSNHELLNKCLSAVKRDKFLLCVPKTQQFISTKHVFGDLTAKKYSKRMRSLPSFYFSAHLTKACFHLRNRILENEFP